MSIIVDGWQVKLVHGTPTSLTTTTAFGSLDLDEDLSSLGSRLHHPVKSEKGIS